MKAAVFYGKEDVRIEERPVPVPGENQILVAINYCGICGSDQDRWAKGSGEVDLSHGKGMILGHEKVGVVAAVGPGVTTFAPGDKVLCGPPGYCPEMCQPCREGRPNICLHGFARTPGIGGPDGGFADYFLVEDLAHSAIIKMPPETDMMKAALFDIYCVALHAVRRSRVKLGDYVVVSGTGSIGMAAIALLKAAGVGKLIALGTTSAKFPLLKEYGADYCINVNETEDLAGEIKRIFGREVGADVTFECAGNNKSMENCVYCATKPGGEVVSVGGIVDPLTIIQDKLNIVEINLTATFAFTEDDLRIYIDLINMDKVYVGKMVTKIISLQDCVEEGLKPDNRKNNIKILIDPRL